MHHHIRPRLGQLPTILYGTGIGTVIGIGSAVLWMYVIAPGQSLWLIGASATACATLLTAASAGARRIRRPRPARTHRRAHARKAA